MKILMVSHYFDAHRGGVEIVAGRLARELAALGHEVVWAATDAPPPAPKQPRLVPLPALHILERVAGLPLPIPTPAAFLALFREAALADVIFVHDGIYLSSQAAAFAARHAGKPLLLLQHISAIPYPRPLPRALMAAANLVFTRPLFRRADRVVMISESTAAHFAKEPTRAPPRIVANGVDSDVFRPPAGAAAKNALRAKLGLPPGERIALFVGRFVENKGLRALERMARKRAGICFAFAGWGPIDPDAWNLPNVRVFRGLQGATLAELYQASDALVLPSFAEGFPLVVQEALASGLPVVCGLDAAVADHAAAEFLRGVKVTPGDPAATAERFCHALEKCLAGDGATAAERHRFARARYSWPAAAQRYVELLEEMRR